MLAVLEYHLGSTGYVRNYIHFYAQLATLFQALKTFLLCDILISGQQRWVYTTKTKLILSTPKELAFFQSIQDALSYPSTLVHHNHNMTL